MNLARGICGAYGGYEIAEVRDVRRVGGGGGKRVRYSLDDLGVFGINADQWTTAAQDKGKWHRTVAQGAERFMAK